MESHIDLSLRPILNLQVFDPPECLIVGNEHQIQGQGVGSNHHVEIAHRLAFSLQRGTQVCILPGRAGVPRQDGHSQEELFDNPVSVRSLREPGGSKPQFPLGYRGYGNL